VLALGSSAFDPYRHNQRPLKGRLLRMEGKKSGQSGNCEMAHRHELFRLLRLN
jgi:hypothetical protein